MKGFCATIMIHVFQMRVLQETVACHRSLSARLHTAICLVAMNLGKICLQEQGIEVLPSIF